MKKSALSITIIAILVLADTLTAETTGKWVNYTDSNSVTCMARDNQGYLWCGTGGGVVRIDINTGDKVVYTRVDGLSCHGVYSLAINGDGTKFFSTAEGGISLLKNDGSWVTYNRNNSELAHDTVMAIAIDPDGSVWCGTLFAGVSVLSPDGTWTTYDTSNCGIASNLIRAITIDTEGNKWFGTNQDGVSLLKVDGTWETFNKENSGIVSNWVRDIAISAKGDVWFSLYIQGVSVLRKDGSWQNYNPENSGLALDIVHNVEIDPDGSKWFCNADGLSIMNKNGSWDIFNTYNSGIASNSVTEIATDADGNKWILSRYGVSVFSPDKTFPPIRFDLYTDPEKYYYKSEDNFDLLLDVQSPAADTRIDLYLVLLNVYTNELFFSLSWDNNPAPAFANMTLPANLDMSGIKIMNFTIPSGNPPIGTSGFHTFAIGATKAGTFNFISNVATASFYTYNDGE